MLDSLVQMIIGASATVAYLMLWRRLLDATGPQVARGDDVKERRLRQRRQLAQLLLFLILTPYVLVVFRLMDLVRTWLGDDSPSSM